MNNECQKYKDKIANFVSGILPDSEVESLQEHLEKCTECNEYANVLKSEDKLLTDFFAQVDSDTQTREQKVLDAMNIPEQQKTSPRKMFGPLIRLAAAAAIIFVVLFGFGKLGNTSIAWADVVEKFKSVEFFSAVFYEKEDALSQPKQIELWMGHSGYVRVRMDSQVIFGKNGKVTDAFDVTTRQKVEAEYFAERMLEMLSSTNGQFSLDTILNIIAKGSLKDVTPLINSDAIISEDLVVFDSQLNDTQWMRIWALRESKLPVHIRIWGSSDGYCFDAFMNYSKKQPDEFFDPNAFEQVLRKNDERNNTNIAYAFLTDHGGKDITPKDMFNKSGYHMPAIKRAGISEGGAFWIIAEKARNRLPDGGEFYGFSKMEDNLGRTYINVGGGYNLDGERSRDIFVPIDFPFDERRPSRVTLTCDTRKHNVSNPELIGTIDLTQWEIDTPCPQLSGPGITSDSGMKINLAYNFINRKDNDRLERILDSIPGEPESSNTAYNREKIRLKMLVRNNEYDEAVKLGERLMPLLENEYRRWKGSAPNPQIFIDYIEALVYSGKLDEAEKTWRHIKDIKPELSPNLNKAARKSIEESRQYGFEVCLHVMVPGFSSKAHLTINQINKIFDIEVRNNELFKHYTFWDWNPEFEKPKYKNWERHLAELTEYYRIYSLPETMEILEREKKEKFGAHKREMPGITSHYVENIQRTLQSWATSYQSRDLAGRVRIEGDVLDIELNHDLVYQKDTPSSEIIPFLLRHFGLEIVEVNEPRTVWIANYDGRKLKDYNEVVSPVPYTGGERTTGMMASSVSSGWDLKYLFETFMTRQNEDYKAQGILIIDQTGIDEPVSKEGPNWQGSEAPEIARKWFHDEFGITFTEETRMMKTYVIRKKTE